MFTSKPKAILSAIILCLMAGCVKDFTDTQHASKAVDVAKEESVTIINGARNTTLHIDNCNVCKVVPIDVAYKDTVELCGVIQNVDTLVLGGEIRSGSMSLYKGLMFVPYARVIKLHAGCDWFDSDGNKILYSIEFDATVNGWK